MEQKRLIDIRKEKGLTRKYVAEQIGMKELTLQHKELGYRRFTVSDIRKLTELYQVSLAEIAD